MGKIKKSESKGKDKDPRPKSSYASNKTNKIPLSSSDSPRQRPRITLQDVLGADKTMRRGKEGKGSDKGDVLSQSSSSSSSEMPPESEWDEQALALKEQIEGGAFDHLLMEPRRKAQQRAAGRRKPQQQGQESDDDDGSSSSSIEVVDLEGDYDEDDEAVVGKPDELEFVGRNDDVGSCSDDDSKSAMEDSEASNEEDREGSDDELDDEKSEKVDDVAESPEESDENADEDQQDRTTRLSKQNNINSKALHIVTESLQSQKHSWAWAETFDVVSTDPLPFGKKSSAGDEALVDIHDDLKREVAFYDMALAAVAQAREKCSVSKIPFSRPDDFFAEMVKTDDHMAKVKDRLIFETKKMEAVAQRKSNKELKLRAREAQANRAAEKAKRKREHFASLDEWAQSAASKRGRRTVDDDDEDRLRAFGRSRSPGTPNKKRIAADKKFGYGGKRGRFKQNDRKTLNDTSAFNPRGSNFVGGTKITPKSKKGSGGKNKRPGKRARDAKRSNR